MTDTLRNKDASRNEDASEKTANLLAAVWLRTRPVVEQRLTVLDRAATAAAAGSLSVEVREEAADTAHKLAGSLGMYGFAEGTQVARQLELLLDYQTPDPAVLTELTVELRRILLSDA